MAFLVEQQAYWRASASIVYVPYEHNICNGAEALPLSLLHPYNVMTQIHNDLSGSLSPGSNESNVYMLGKDISGGYIGGLEYAALLWLFGSLGAKLLMIVMLAISFMLITNLSYVEIFTLLRVRLVKFVEGIRLHAANRPKAVPVADLLEPLLQLRLGR